MDPITVEELHSEIGRLIRSKKHAPVLNVNAHCLNLCYRDSKLRNFFNRAAVVFCDGAGVMLGARMLGQHIPERITYADWMWRLAALAESESYTLYFLGGRPGFADGAASRLKERFPALKIVGIHHGYFDRAAGSPDNEAVIEEINAVQPNILLVGFGMPLQEYWLIENWHRVNANVALTGGAVFGYISGNLRRGPSLLTNNGFEWLARLLVQPRHLWRRYLIGNPLFLVRVLRQRLSKKGRHSTTR